ncbi:MAG: methyl-accepting chemotaxis protein [Azospirillaceae bacterium]|nr:methyl-accepting chemotaxis protein [Azospirillaceae bacterium]
MTMGMIDRALSRASIRSRIFGGFAFNLAFLLLIAFFAWAKVGVIGETVGDLVVSAEADVGMSAARTALADVNSGVERYIRTRSLGDREAAKVAIEKFTAALAVVQEHSSSVSAVSENAAALAEGVTRYRAAFDAIAAAVDQVRALSDQTDGFGAAAGLRTDGILEALANGGTGAMPVNAIRLSFHVELARVATLHYAMTQTPAEGTEAQRSLRMALSAVGDVLGDLGQSDSRAKTLADLLRHSLDDDIKAMDALSTAVGNLKAAQTSLQQAGKAISAQTDKISQVLSGLRSEQKDVTQAMVKRTRTLVFAVATIALLLGGVFAWTVGTSVSGPILKMTRAMRTIADGRLETEIPALDLYDEVGQMARAVEVFKKNMSETESLRAQQEQTKRHSEMEKRAVMQKMAEEFESNVQGIVEIVSSASTELQSTAQSMSATAEQTQRQSHAVAAASDTASSNVQTVAAATEELSSSTAEIGRQVVESSRIAAQAVQDARDTDKQVQALAAAAQKIGEVVSLINDIASQTNLLALNATIEAARAGEAGRGFAVVANEVKHLANQTANATGDIAAQVKSIQQATNDSVVAIRKIGATIGLIDEIATTIAAAVEEQGAATREIARNVQQAAVGTSEVSLNIAGVTSAAAETGAAASEVLGAAGELARQSDTLRTQVEGFIARIRAG